MGCGNHEEQGIYTIPNGTGRIWKGAFANCRYGSIRIPNSIREVGQGAFISCENLTRLIFPEGVERIEFGIIQNSAVQTIYLPHSLRDISSIDDQGRSLTDIYYNGTTAEWKSL